MNFLYEINSDIQWRMSELASLRTIPFRYRLLPNHKDILIKYTIPSIYSLWEGYVKNTFELYAREINSLNIPIKDVHINLLTHALSNHDKLSLENPRMSFVKKKEFIDFYQKRVEEPLFLTNKLPTKSNIDYDVINEILCRFNLDKLEENYNSKLKKLLWFRNNIAHGDSSIPVSTDDISSFSDLVIDLMIDVFNRIEYGYTNKTFNT